jgi:hypothetical protein
MYPLSHSVKMYKTCGAWEKAINTLKELIICNEKMVE